MKKDLDIFASTFNCAKQFPFDNEGFMSLLVEQLLPRVGLHDVYILGFQELVPIWQGSFAGMVLEYLETLQKLILKRLNLNSTSYKYIQSNCLGAIGILVFSKSEYDILNVMTCNIRCGTFCSSLKGASAIKFSISKDNLVETIVAISAHLAANEGEQNLQRRLTDYDTIMNEMRIAFGDLLSSHIFFVGDMNFRLTARFSDVNYTNPDTIRHLVEQNDELTRAIRENKSFKPFSEPTISFPPTFKYHLHEKNVDADPLEYNLKRQPSWCDRILYRRYKKPFEIHLYKPIPRTSDFYFTDHQPVILSMTVPHIQHDEFTGVQFSTSLKSSTALTLSSGRLVDIILGYSGWLYFEHPFATFLGLLTLFIYGWYL